MSLRTTLIYICDVQIESDVLLILIGTPENCCTCVADRNLGEKHIKHSIGQDCNAEGCVEQVGLILPDEVEAYQGTYHHNTQSQVPAEVFLNVERALVTGRTAIDKVALSDRIRKEDFFGMVAIRAG